MWAQASDEPDLIDNWLIMQKLMSGVAARDYKYLVEKGGRERQITDDAKSEENSELTRTHLSYLIYYGLLGHISDVSGIMQRGVLSRQSGRGLQVGERFRSKNLKEERIWL